MTSLVESNRHDCRQQRQRVATGAASDAALIGLLGFVIGVAFSWVPSIWFDEAATISATTRSWSELWRMLGNVDAVHGVYYAGMHLWFDLVGYSPFTLRLPSSIATGIVAALIVLLVRSVASRRTAVVAGLFFCLLPRVTWMGTEGRDYALTAALAVALTIVFLAAWRRGTASRSIQVRWWILYGALAVVFSTVFLYLALLVAAHGVTAAWTRWSCRKNRASTPAASASLRGWLLSSVGAALVLSPFMIAVVRQTGQVRWINPIGWETFHGIFVSQWFLENPAFATVGWILITVGVLALVRRSRHLPADRRPHNPSLLSVALPWLSVPIIGLVLASIVISPLYSPRYLTYSAPAAAILIGVAVSALRRRWLIVVALAACVALATPQIVAQRMPEAKQQSSWSEVAHLVSRQRALEPAGISEAIIYGPVRQHPAATTRVIAYAYPEAFAGLIDVTLNTPAAETGHLWETRYPLEDSLNRIDGIGVVWLVTSNKQDWRPSVTQKLGALGYTLREQWNLTGVNVLRFEL